MCWINGVIKREGRYGILYYISCRYGNAQRMVPRYPIRQTIVVQSLFPALMSCNESPTQTGPWVRLPTELFCPPAVFRYFCVCLTQSNFLSSYMDTCDSLVRFFTSGFFQKNFRVGIISIGGFQERFWSFLDDFRWDKTIPVHNRESWLLSDAYT